MLGKLVTLTITHAEEDSAIVQTWDIMLFTGCVTKLLKLVRVGMFDSKYA